MAKATPVFTPRDGTPTKIPIADIKVGTRLRALDQEVVKLLAVSMAVGGLKAPITVRRTAEGYELIAGWHRLEAARVLEWQEISAITVVGSERQARLWEIDENLCRSELTPLERAELGHPQGCSHKNKASGKPHATWMFPDLRFNAISRSPPLRRKQKKPPAKPE
jgi:hypothetical protein